MRVRRRDKAPFTRDEWLGRCEAEDLGVAEPPDGRSLAARPERVRSVENERHTSLERKLGEPCGLTRRSGYVRRDQDSRSV